MAVLAGQTRKKVWSLHQQTGSMTVINRVLKLTNKGVKGVMLELLELLQERAI